MLLQQSAFSKEISLTSHSNRTMVLSNHFNGTRFDKIHVISSIAFFIHHMIGRKVSVFDTVTQQARKRRHINFWPTFLVESLLRFLITCFDKTFLATDLSVGVTPDNSCLEKLGLQFRFEATHGCQTRSTAFNLGSAGRFSLGPRMLQHLQCRQSLFRISMHEFSKQIFGTSRQMTSHIGTINRNTISWILNTSFNFFIRRFSLQIKGMGSR
mmetsp:Transcript_915/g.2384  ORF Transcript_915/g.2384 Transcript_915/m.2384 type:complete len:212 (-) Transcript_915:1103-1738(-)